MRKIHSVCTKQGVVFEVGKRTTTGVKPNFRNWVIVAIDEIDRGLLIRLQRVLEECRPWHGELDRFQGLWIPTIHIANTTDSMEADQ
jgi:hypothetical protein